MGVFAQAGWAFCHAAFEVRAHPAAAKKAAGTWRYRPFKRGPEPRASPGSTQLMGSVATLSAFLTGVVTFTISVPEPPPQPTMAS
jgi:hypothetical protein